MSDHEFDVVIIGGGIVGAAMAYHLAPHRRVVILEAEAAAGYHASGRSAALFEPSYGPESIRSLTRASEAFFRSPPEGFADSPLIHPRGALFVGRQEQVPAVEAFYQQQSLESDTVRCLNTDEALALVPVLAREAAVKAVYDTGAFDIEVDLLLQGFLKQAKSNGAVFVRNARVNNIQSCAPGWRVTTEEGLIVRGTVLVNAAGAWVDQIAQLAGVSAVGIEPRRRSAFIFEAPANIDCSQWPMTIGIEENWYFKPDAGALLGSPANADPVEPHDVVAEELDIATAIYFIEQNTKLRIRRPRHTWAGLRSFVADGEPVCGFDQGHTDFFWAAALGGYGIQSAPAFGRLCACLILGKGVPEDIQAQGLDLRKVSPQRSGLRWTPS
ncbi:FAD-binding oxidoreductase [Aestuariicella hydrocarbonica]|uniref:FAD-binding oxidoreductase n=1 Tax=Pseudomaricurvus hydrocarbonicus TaxID=1470433 RepID=A0A9E5JUC4_9GAMM|nr:FAD-binding oxidoreductase [Aestuariicella hydrocarbonica]NHO66987.1 FAD-binding oxidoreductase [Aestuariicella hydrocarbonica]